MMRRGGGKVRKRRFPLPPSKVVGLEPEGLLLTALPPEAPVRIISIGH